MRDERQDLFASSMVIIKLDGISNMQSSLENFFLACSPKSAFDSALNVIFNLSLRLQLLLERKSKNSSIVL